DDLVRLHPGVRAALDRPRCGRHVAPDPGHRGGGGDARGHLSRGVPDPGALRDRGKARRRRAPAPERARGSPGSSGRRAAGDRGGALMKRLVLLILAPPALAGCSLVGPRYQRPALNVPAEHRGQVGAVEAASLADQPWWEVFHDDALKALIAEALKNGYDIRLAAWRGEEARANAGIVRAQGYPSLQGQAEVGYGRQSEFSTTPGAQGALIQLNVNAAWEL